MLSPDESSNAFLHEAQDAFSTMAGLKALGGKGAGTLPPPTAAAAAPFVPLLLERLIPPPPAEEEEAGPLLTGREDIRLLGAGRPLFMAGVEEPEAVKPG